MSRRLLTSLSLLVAPMLATVGRHSRRNRTPNAPRRLLMESLENRALLSATEVTIGNPELLLGDVNTQDRERSASISSDGLKLYFQRSESFALNGNFNTPINTELMVATRASVEAPWDVAVPVGAPINSVHPDTWPEISADGNTLYFSDTSDPPAPDFPREGGEDPGDLWMSTKDEFDQWQTPVNLGSTINSEARDGTPDLSADGLTLFFTSHRSGGSGGADLYMAKRPSQLDPWDPPENLGAVINSQYEDVHPSISPDGLTLSFSSNRGSGGADFWDIWIATRPSLSAEFGSPFSLRAQLPDGFQGTHGPEFSADGSTLYFDSRGFSPSNSFDIWEVPISIDNVVFSDSFESGQWNGNWKQDSQNDWRVSTQRATDGSFSAEVDGRANDAALEMLSPIDLSGYSSAELRFDWLIEGSFDTGEYLAVDVSTDGGITWQSPPLAQLDGNVDPEGVWVAEAIDLTSHLSDNTSIRFRGTSNRSAEDANVDNVRIVTGEPAAPASPVITIEDVTIDEGDAGSTTASFTVTRSGDPGVAVSVDYETQDGSAMAPADYVDIALSTLTFGIGETTKTIDVIVNGDESDEGDEQFYVNLSNPSVGTSLAKAQGTATIQDDDATAAQTMYVADLDATSTPASRGKWTATVSIIVLDASGSTVSGATVNFVRSNGQTGSVTTNANGIATITWSNINKKTQSVTFTITSLVHASFTYDEGSNTDPDGDSDGTTITVNKP